MKIILAGLAAATILSLAAPAMAAAPVCLRTQDIKNTTPKNHGTVIEFAMQDGSVWRNNLRGHCPDLQFDGFIWTVRNPGGQVCENEQTLRVINSGEVCGLGKFTQITPPRAAHHN